MPYCTLQDLIDRLGEPELIQLTEVADTQVIDTVAVDRAIADTDALIDSHLAGRHQLPLASVPTLLRNLACHITRYHLHTDTVPDLVKERYESSMRALRDIRDGRTSLGLDDSGNAQPAAGGAEIKSAGSAFSRDKATGFI